MPELPEVETVVREIENHALHQKIVKAEIYTRKIRIDVPDNLPRKLKNQKILKLDRRAKYILIHLENSHILVIHLGMSGRIRIGPDMKEKPAKHDHMALLLSNGDRLVFNDPRRFGLVEYLPEQEADSHILFAHLGLEPLSASFTASFLFNALQARKIAVKVALMDQKLVVGVGNIYASEALFEAGIRPERPANNLTKEEVKKLTSSIKTVLKKAIKAGGSTLKDYRKTNGDLGYFQHQFSVYDREGKPCGKCNCDLSRTAGVQKIVQAGRSTFYCPRKQV